MEEAQPVTDSETQSILLRLKALCVASETAAAEHAAEHLARTGYPDMFTPMLTVEQVRAVLQNGWDETTLTFEQAAEQVEIAELALTDARRLQKMVGVRDGYDE